MKHLFLVGLAVSATAATFACDGFVAGRKASSSGRVMVAHNEDNLPKHQVRHSMLPAGAPLFDEPGCVKIPQEADTCACFWSEVYSPDGEPRPGDFFYNENGVLIYSNNGGVYDDWYGIKYSLPDEGFYSSCTDGGLGINLRFAVAQRARTAAEGVSIMTNLVMTYGYRPLSRLFTIADKNEAWLVQVLRGRRFVARRCPDDQVAAYPNCLTISKIEPGDICSPNIESKRDTFDFAAFYQGPRTWKSPFNFHRGLDLYRLVGGIDVKAGEIYPFSLKPSRKVAAEDIKRGLSSHYEGMSYEVKPKHPDKGPDVIEPICRKTTLESMVCVFGEMPYDTVIMLATGRPCETPYIAFRPFAGILPEDTVSGVEAVRRISEHFKPAPGSKAAPVFELAKEGAVRAAIVLPAKPNGVEKFAAEELKYHLDKMFAADFKVVGEADLGNADGASRIFLGATKAAVDAGIPGKPFDEEEHVVKTVGGDLFLVGADGNLTYEDVGNLGKCRQCGTLYAVYDFLETELGVKWIWPGELGEVIEKRRSFFLPPTDRRRGEPLVSRKWYGTGEPKGEVRGFSSAEARSRFYAAQRRFLCRHRYGHRREIASGHSFGNWWKRFGKDHPEYFNRLSTGERKPLYNNVHGVTMCVSEPGVWRQKVEDWRKNLPGVRKSAKSPNARFEWINCCENDYAGLCTCAKCRSWDSPDPRFALNDYWSGKADAVYLAALFKAEGFYGLDRVCGDERWILPKIDPAKRNAASLSDRYAKFYNAVIAEARKFEPDARVIGYAYDNYLEAPKQTRVDGGVVIEFVPRSYFPSDKMESDFFRKHWRGWREAGVRDFVLRPNYMLAGGNYPIDNGRWILDDFAFAYTNGMIACGFDSLRGSWSCHLLMDYALTRAFRDPLRGYEKAREDVLSAFGPAASLVARYFDRVETFTASWTEEKVREASLKNIVGGRTPGGSFPYTPAILGEFYDDRFFPEVQGILEAARRVADGDATIIARIDYLRKGLRDAELTRNCRIAQKKYDAEKTEAAKRAWHEAFRELARYRKSVERDFICAFDKEAKDEARMGWPHDKLGKEYEVW